ncbi:hypothetical protein BCR24_01585 [Enterococcus ureilyticus]|uniref:RiboL-PSP-HEPN domain-containing protein n=1 Tax=Enterococcus ureilyticus TaxID=1131292 RepID=A0A1E5HGL3_9ENTE|nr:HEPN domain-containing protein [Enterococcus ureilyticus]MBM7689648.1 hypothetical protein [Enterococcus ureilyticus]OEG24071.1 hypothetical protein BCR24_01585 [Enterococcus ureilyticus]
MIDRYLKKINEVIGLIELYENILTITHSRIKEEANILKLNMYKSSVINLYTCWENYIKDIVYSSFEENKSLIMDAGFIKDYIEHAFSKSYIKKDFLSTLDSNEIIISKKNLCSSNNLKYKEMLELFGRINFNKDDLQKHFKNKNLDKTIEELNQSNVEIDIEGEEVPKNEVEKYLNTLVTHRNRISHAYDIDLIFNTKQLKNYCEFFKELMIIVNEYKASQSIKMFKQLDNTLVSEIKITNIWHENTVNPQTNAIIETKITGKRKKIYIGEVKWFVFDRNDKIYRRINVKSMRNKKRRKCKIIPIDELFSLEIDAECRITKGKTNELFEMNKAPLQDPVNIKIY